MRVTAKIFTIGHGVRASESHTGTSLKRRFETEGSMSVESSSPNAA